MGKNILQVSTKEIIESINAGFMESYKPFSTYQKEENELWDRCIKMVGDYDLVNKVIFCNDVLEIPPAKIFIALNNDILDTLTAYDKKFIGAFWGYVFKCIFYYKGQKQVGINSKHVKTATYYSNNDTFIQVI